MTFIVPDSDATRIASVNPLTGTEHACPHGKTFEADEDDLTVISNPHSHGATVSTKNTEQFIPVDNMRKTGEQTTLWTPPRRPWRQTIRSVIGNVRSHRRRVAIIAGILLSIPVMVITSFTLASSTPDGTVVSSEAGTAYDTDTGASNQDTAAPGVGRIAPSHTLSDAIICLKEEDYECALSIYRHLAKQAPDEPSYQTAIKILDGRRAHEDTP